MTHSHQDTPENLSNVSHASSDASIESESRKDLWPLTTQQKWVFDQQKNGQIGAYNQLLLRLDPEFLKLRKQGLQEQELRKQELQQQARTEQDDAEHIKYLVQHAFEAVMTQHDVFTLDLVYDSQFKYPQLAANSGHCLLVNTRQLDIKTSDAPEHRLLANSAASYESAHGDNRVVIDIWTLTSGTFICATVGNHVLDQNSLWQLCDLAGTYLHTQTMVNSSTVNSSAADVYADVEDITQYSQYIAWQQDLAQDEDADLAKDYWQAVLDAKEEGGESLLQPAHANIQSTTHIEHRTQTITLALPDDANRQMTLLVAWQCIYARLMRTEKATVYTAMDLRHEYEELSQSLGCFQNWVPFNTTIAEDSGFNSLLAWTDEQWQEHSEWLDFFQHTDNATTSDCFFHYREVRAVSPEDSDRSVLKMQLQSELQRAGGLILHCTDNGSTVTLQLSIDTAVLPALWADQLLPCFKYFLQQSLENSAQSVLTLPLLSPGQLQAIPSTTQLPSWEQTASVIERFERSVERFPKRMALVCENTSLSYAALNCAAHQLAQKLVSVSDNQPVLLCIERSAAMIIGLLACLKAGKPYVPLDPDQPAKRLQKISEHTQASIMLIHATQTAPAYFTGQVMVIDAEQLTNEEPSVTDKPLANGHQRGDELAYVIYTSGSTGEPKAVGINHRNLEHYIDSICDVLPIKDGMTYATVSTLSADLGNTAIFPALTQGGTLHVIDYNCSTDGVAFSEYIHTHAIDVLKIVPSHYQALCAALPDDQPLLPRTALVFGGELLSAALAVECQNAAATLSHPCQIFNHYGPTETTIGAFTLDIQRAQEQGLELANHNSVPIGFPLGDGQFFVADAFGNVVPSGCSGELYIGGPGVCQGYLGHDALNQRNNERSFCYRHDFTGQDQRFYRTGDLVRELNCGGLEFLGRTDEQVKLRGFRIELNAIRHALCEHEQVSNALVMVVDQHITAFCVTSGSTEESTLKAELQERANQQLPHYMVPSQWVFIRRLPLTDNGKPNRKELLILAENNSQTVAIEPAQTPTEESLICIWQNLLGRENIGRNSHFFESGGHSLLATQLVFKTQTELAVDISLGQIFDTPILWQLAEFIGNKTINNKDLDSTINVISKHPEDVNVPLTFAQQRLWFMQQLAPNSPAYNVPAVIDLHGELNVACLQRAFAAVLHRHSGLCAQFRVDDGAVHFADSNYELPELELVDVSLLPESEVTNGNNALILKPFDLLREPAIRVGFFRFNTTHHQLVVVMHHIICDGWSRDVLIQDLTQAYQAFCHDQPSSWAELPINYKDFAYWQSQQFEQRLAPQVSYWKNYLTSEHETDEQEALKLSADQRRPEQQQFNGEVHGFAIDEAIVADLRALSNKHQTTLFTTLLTAFHVLLLRYSGQPLVRVGFPIAGRNHGGLENLVGLLTNTLVTQTQNKPVPFNTLLEQQRDDMRQAFEHQDVPFEMLVEHLQPRRSLSHSPLFQAFFSLQPARKTGVAMDGIQLDLQATAHVSSKFDVSLLIEETVVEGLDNAENTSVLRASLEYDTALFDAVWIERFTHHYLNLLQAIVNDSTQNIQTLPMLTPQEQQKSVESAQLKTSDIHFCLLSHIQQYADTQPSAVALVFDQKAWTYAQLMDEVAVIRAGLLAHGIGMDDRVVLRLERSADLLFSMLAVLQIEACFVPLDPILPTDRQNYIIEQCRATLVLSDACGPELLTPTNQNLWQTLGDIKCRAGGALHEKATFSNNTLRPAYILYTSGSTGKPKGVEVGVQALNCLLEAMQSTLGLQPSDAWLAITSISFDISLLELLLPLGTGASVVLTSAKQSRTPQDLAALIEQQSITVMQATPGAWQQLLESGWQAPHHMTLLSGGEAMTSSLAAKLLPQAERLLNVYGPTEATIWASCKVVTQADHITLGKPLKHYRNYVVNDSLEIQLDGCVGQLAIAGPGLANGYFDQDALTAERFVNSPQLGRLYLTGDLAYQDDNGELHYLGRVDDQIKWRGYRIELNEVAESVERLSQVGMAFCHLLDDQLICFYTMSEPLNHEQFNHGQLNHEQSKKTFNIKENESLRAWLPAYMFPSQFICLDALPLTTSGKVDRQALKHYWHKRKDQMLLDNSVQGNNEALFSTIEKDIMSLWQDLLPGTVLRREDDFFAVGGHSLLLTRLLDKLRTTFTCDLPLHALFEATTIAKQAALIEQAQAVLIEQANADAHTSSHSTILPVHQKTTAPLSFAQQRLWFLDQFITDRSAYHIPLAIKLTGSLHIAALDCSLQKLLLDHPQLRVAFSNATADNQHPTQTLCVEHELQLQHIVVGENSDVIDNDVDGTLAALAKQPIALDCAPLMNAFLLSESHTKKQTEHTLLLVIHHIVTDGWSLSHVYRDIVANYKQFSRLTNDELTIQRANLIQAQSQPRQQATLEYMDFAAWQHSDDFKHRLSEQLTYWQRYLGTELTPLALPLDYPRPPVQTFHGSVVRHTLTPALSKQLSALAGQKQCSLFVLFMAVYAKLLSRYSNQDEVFIGTPIANRHMQGTSAICGLFANTQVYRCQFAEEQTLDACIAQIKQDSIAAQQHQDLPFEQLVNAISPERDQSRTPLFQAMMTLVQGNSAILSDLSDVNGLDITLMENTKVSAKFDLTLAVNVHSENNIELAFEYNTDLFSRKTLCDMMATLQAQCEYLASASNAGTEVEIKVEQLNVLPKAHTKVYEKINNTAVNFDLRSTVIDLFARQAITTPTSIAVSFDDSASLTYQQLDTLTSRVAEQICLHDTRSNPVVGLIFDRSLSMVVALLGILKAGAAYLPISPSLPQTRKTFMLDNAECQFVICQSAYHRDEIEKNAHYWSLDDTDLTGMLNAPASTNDLNAPIIPSAPQADDTAYVIYTSGSTGEPKGVAVSHGSLINRLHWQQSLHPIDENDVVLQKTPYGFDVSVWEFLWPVITGAKLVVAAPEAHIDPFELTRLIQDNNVTVMHFVPSMLQAFCDSFSANGSFDRSPQQTAQPLSSLNAIICSGEALTLPLARQAFRLLPAVDIYNLYGPTEAAIDVSVWHVNNILNANWQGSHIPIGKPIANTQLYVLDKNQQPVPPGVIGELYIAGVGLAKGYIGQPALTDERFVHITLNHTADEQSMRAYRTGDLARWCWETRAQQNDVLSEPSLTLEYLGRTDGQIKLRGQRLELSEVEAVLLQHRDIEQAYVIAYPAETPEYLVACVISSQTEFSPERIQQYTRGLLPSYMVPSHIVRMDTIPLSANGKADRKQLYRHIEQTQKQLLTEQHEALKAATQVDSPLSARGQAVCDLVATLLSMGAVHPDHDLFDLGAHSLWMVNLQQQLARQFHVKLALNVLFSHSKIADLITLVEASVVANPETKQSETPKQAPAIGSHDTDVQNGANNIPFLMPLAHAEINSTGDKPLPTLYCIHPASGFSGPFQTIANAMSTHCHVVGVNAADALHSGDYATSIDDIAAKYVADIQTQHTTGDYYLLGWSLGGHIAVAMTRLLEQQGATVRWVGIVDSLLLPEQQPKPSSHITESDALQQRVSFYVNSLALLGVPSLSDKQTEQLHSVLLANPVNHHTAICTWAEQEGVLGHRFSVSHLMTMLNLIDQGKTLVHHGADNCTAVNAPMNFYWANETLEHVSEPDILIQESHNLSLGGANSRRYPTNHQAIINDPTVIRHMLADVINAISNNAIHKEQSHANNTLEA